MRERHAVGLRGVAPDRRDEPFLVRCAGVEPALARDHPSHTHRGEARNRVGETRQHQSGVSRKLWVSTWRATLWAISTPSSTAERKWMPPQMRAFETSYSRSSTVA